jgi:hypothetical protein
LVSFFWLGDKAATMKKMEEVNLMLFDIGPPHELMTINGNDCFVFYMIKHKTRWQFLQIWALIIMWNATLNGNFWVNRV